MINKKLILSLLPILAIGALASCAGKPGPESDVDSVPESQPDSESGETQKTNISIWTTLSYQTQLENMIASFEEANPNIHVENVKVSGSYDDLKSKIRDIKKQIGIKIICDGIINQNHGQYFGSPANSPTGTVLKNLGHKLARALLIKSSLGSQI